MRGWPIIITRITDDRPAIAPSSTSGASHHSSAGTLWIAYDTGCAMPLKLWYGIMPVRISDTTM